METTDTGQKPQTLKVGRDQVTVSEKQVVIDAAAEMTEWQVREFNRAIIFFQEKKYFLRQKSLAQKPYRVRYVLELWQGDAPTSGGSFTYDEEAVIQRDAAIKQGHMEDVVRSFLYLFYPFLGLLWSGTKDKLARFSIVSRTVTGISIMLTFGVILLDGVFAKMLLMGSIKTGTVAVGGIIRTFYGKDFLELGPISVPVVWLDVALFVFMVLDVIIRYSQHLRDAESPWGFLEWLKCLVPRGKIPATTRPAAKTLNAPVAPGPPPLPVEAVAPVVAAPTLIPGPRFEQQSPAGSGAAQSVPPPPVKPDAPAVPAPILIPGPRFEQEASSKASPAVASLPALPVEPSAAGAAPTLIPGPRFDQESPKTSAGDKAA